MEAVADGRPNGARPDATPAGANVHKVP